MWRPQPSQNQVKTFLEVEDGVSWSTEVYAVQYLSFLSLPFFKFSYVRFAKLELADILLVMPQCKLPVPNTFLFLYTAVDQHGNDSHSHTSPSVTFTIQLKRHTTYYIVILFLPCFSNAMLTLLVFLLPPETGERIGVGINTLFTMWVNYLRVSVFSWVLWLSF